MDRDQRWAHELSLGAEKLGVSLNDAQSDLLVGFLLLLCKWNKAFNLTAIRDENEMVSRQLLDSLSIVPFIQGETVLDVGTGPGLPGIPLAILMPNRKFSLLDSNGKKTRFVQQCKTALELSNIEVINGRVEALQRDEQFDTITSRAFSSLPKFIQLTRHLLQPDGRWVAMKGTLPKQEIDELAALGFAIETEVLQVPGTAGERHVVIVSREGVEG